MRILRPGSGQVSNIEHRILNGEVEIAASAFGLLAMTKKSQDSTYYPVNGYFFDFFLSVLDIGQANENSGGTAAA